MVKMRCYDEMGYYTGPEAAKVLRVSKMTLYRWAAKGKIPGPRRHPINGYRMYTKGDIDKIKKLIERG